jgi:small subunit ribosomal protein S3Ae
LRSHPSHKNYWTKYCSNKNIIEIASDSLKGRVIETSLTDLKKSDEGASKAYRKIKLIVEDVEGSSCFSNFHGMDVTRDKLCSLIRKWQTTIEAHVDVKTSDDYFLRLFVICFTARMQRQLRATSYATASKIKLIRRKMVEIIMKRVQQLTFKALIPELMDEKIEEEIKKQCARFYPLQNVLITKAKVLKKPRFDASKMIEFYGDHAGSANEILAQAPIQTEEPKNLIAVPEKK